MYSKSKSNLSAFTPIIFIVFFIVFFFFFSPTSLALCGTGPDCPSYQYCNMSCPSPPNVGQCTISCIGDPPNVKTGCQKTDPSLVLSCDSPPVLGCKLSNGGCWGKWPGPVGRVTGNGCTYYDWNPGGGIECQTNCTCISPTPPPTNSVQGIVWEDVNHDGSRTAVDTVFGTSAASACATTVSPTINMTDTVSGTATTDTWSCIGGVSKYTTSSQVDGTTVSVKLTPPKGNCSFVTWNYTICKDATCTTKTTNSGSGCTAKVIGISATYANTLNWKIDIPVRTVSGKIYETTNSGSCSNNATIAVPGLTATMYNGATQVGSGVGISSTDGSYTFSGIPATTIFDSLCINGAVATATKTYVPSCVSASTSGPGYTCSRTGACAMSCTPNSILTTTNATINVGFKGVSNAAWISTFDGDIYGDAITEYVATSPLAGYTPNLITNESASSIGGYGFAGTTINTQTPGSGVSNKGGYGQRLNTLPNYPFLDQWLNKFSFSVPTGAITTVPAGNVFKEGAVYSFTVDQFNLIVANGSYSFVDGNNNPPAAAIIYVIDDPTKTISINNPFVSNNNANNKGKILVLVTTSPIVIDKSVGTTTANYGVGKPSQIDLAVLSGADIAVGSQFDAVSFTYDQPLMLNGSLMSRKSLNLDRNLGYVDNANYPSETVRFFPYLMGLIQKYEMQYATTDPYTGLATVDVQFDYGN